MKVLLEVDVDLIEGKEATPDQVASALAFILEAYEFVANPSDENQSVYNVAAAVGVAETKGEPPAGAT